MLTIQMNHLFVVYYKDIFYLDRGFTKSQFAYSLYWISRAYLFSQLIIKVSESKSQSLHLPFLDEKVVW